MEKRRRNIDMLSGLPDEVLYHILSFLRTKFSVRTSVLAKRWRFLWTHVPNLEFEGHHDSSWIHVIGTDFRGSKTNPLKIINRVMMLHEAKILNTFKLFGVKCCEYQLETFIIYAIKRGVRILHLDFGLNDKNYIMCTLPRLFLTCKTIVDLVLVNCGMIPSSGELFLPSLKKLNLSFVKYEDDYSLPHLLSGCPVLEELIVQKIQNNSGCFIVSSPTIKSLNVDFLLDTEGYAEELLIIGVPALVYLKVICDDLEYAKSLRKTMTALTEVEIVLNGCHVCDFECTKHGRSIEFLSCLSHVTYLKFSSSEGDALFDILGAGSMPKFDNLTKLELELGVHWHYLVKFLEVADNLEVLSVGEIMFCSTNRCFGDQIKLCETPPYKPKRVPPYKHKRVPPCMLSRLRTVTLSNFSPSQDPLDMVRYTLRNAQVLERMEIIHADFPSHTEKLEVLREISLYERGSKSCQLDVM